MGPQESQAKIEAINKSSTSDEDVLRLADELFDSSDLIYVGRHNPLSDEMLQKILHALIKQARK